MPFAWIRSLEYDFSMPSTSCKGELFIHKDRLNLIASDGAGNIKAYTFDKALNRWEENPVYLNNFGPNIPYTKPIHFWKDGLLHLLIGYEGQRAIEGRVWNESLNSWENETTYLNGLPSTFICGDAWLDNNNNLNIILDVAEEGGYCWGCTHAWKWDEGLKKWERNPTLDMPDWKNVTVFKAFDKFRIIAYEHMDNSLPEGYTLNSGWNYDSIVATGLPILYVPVPSTILYGDKIVLVIGRRYKVGGEGYTLAIVPPKLGSISFASDPGGAEIFLDGIDQGIKTPANITDVPVGSHSYVLKLSGYSDYAGTVLVEENKTSQVSAILTPAEGCVYFTTTPQGTRIFLDNVDTKKVTPALICGLSLGAHSFRLVLSGYKDITGTFILVAGKGVTVTGSFEPAGMGAGVLLGLTLLGLGAVGAVVLVGKREGA